MKNAYNYPETEEWKNYDHYIIQTPKNDPSQTIAPLVGVNGRNYLYIEYSHLSTKYAMYHHVYPEMAINHPDFTVSTLGQLETSGASTRKTSPPYTGRGVVMLHFKELEACRQLFKRKEWGKASLSKLKGVTSEKETPKIKDIAVLDTPVSLGMIDHLEKITHGRVNIENISSHESARIDTSHGDMVVHTLVEELVRLYNGNIPKVNIYVYNVVERHDNNFLVSLFNVLCALDHINKHKNNVSYVNMSFMFSEKNELLKRELKSNNSVEYFCAVGNDNRCIKGATNFISSPAVDYISAKNVHPVMGLMKKTQKIWQNDSGPGSNYPISKKQDKKHFLAADAIISDPDEGGTSFASPRALAQYIYNKNRFQVEKIKIPESIVQETWAKVYK